jgi:hypothetical protein
VVLFELNNVAAHFFVVSWQISNMTADACLKVLQS